MTLIRREHRDAVGRSARFADPFRIMDAFLAGEPFLALDTASPAPRAVAPNRAFAPTFDVKESKDAYVFKADLPGIPQADVDIQVLGQVLTVAGQRAQETPQEGERFFAAERGYGRFSRAFALPEGADGERVTAEMKDGVLTVRVPRKAEVQPRRVTVGAAT
jgi:HSP20 family protein